MHSGTVMQQHTTYIRKYKYMYIYVCTFVLRIENWSYGVTGLEKYVEIFFVIINGHVLVHVAFHVLFIVFVIIRTLKTTQYTVETNNF